MKIERRKISHFKKTVGGAILLVEHANDQEALVLVDRVLNDGSAEVSVLVGQLPGEDEDRSLRLYETQLKVFYEMTVLPPHRAQQLREHLWMFQLLREGRPSLLEDK